MSLQPTHAYNTFANGDGGKITIVHPQSVDKLRALGYLLMKRFDSAGVRQHHLSAALHRTITASDVKRYLNRSLDSDIKVPFKRPRLLEFTTQTDVLVKVETPHILTKVESAGIVCAQALQASVRTSSLPFLHLPPALTPESVHSSPQAIDVGSLSSDLLKATTHCSKYEQARTVVERHLPNVRLKPFRFLIDEDLKSPDYSDIVVRTEAVSNPILVNGITTPKSQTVFCRFPRYGATLLQRDALEMLQAAAARFTDHHLTVSIYVAKGELCGRIVYASDAEAKAALRKLSSNVQWCNFSHRMPQRRITQIECSLDRIVRRCSSELLAHLQKHRVDPPTRLFLRLLLWADGWKKSCALKIRGYYNTFSSRVYTFAEARAKETSMPLLMKILADELGHLSSNPIPDLHVSVAAVILDHNSQVHHMRFPFVLPVEFPFFDHGPH